MKNYKDMTNEELQILWGSTGRYRHLGVYGDFNIDDINEHIMFYHNELCNKYHPEVGKTYRKNFIVLRHIAAVTELNNNRPVQRQWKFNLDHFPNPRGLAIHIVENYEWIAYGHIDENKFRCDCGQLRDLLDLSLIK